MGVARRWLGRRVCPTVLAPVRGRFEELARRFGADLEIIATVQRPEGWEGGAYDGPGPMINSGFLDGLDKDAAIERIISASHVLQDAHKEVPLGETHRFGRAQLGAQVLRDGSAELAARRAGKQQVPVVHIQTLCTDHAGRR